jgi:hypothetical protein
MKANAGAAIECASCRKQVGTVVYDILDDSIVRGDDMHITSTTHSNKGPLCDHCRGTAAYHDDQSVGWVMDDRTEYDLCRLSLTV